MSYAFDSRLGEQLYRLLPEVYRTRDKKTGQANTNSGNDDLAKYLDAHGYLLDLIHATLEQQLKDALPKSSQDWLLPYFAQLLAVNIVSPDSDGKHAEVAHAVSWRQRKGTLKCIEEIAEAVGQMEVEIQEGWKRMAMTPRIGMPIIPATAWDDTLEINGSDPSDAARHPALPAVMVDLRRPSRAVKAEPANPAARISKFGGIKETWLQANSHGAPCFPGSFDDVSRRTMDFRTPDERSGRYHPKRLLAYALPPIGFFSFAPKLISWNGEIKSLPKNLIEVKEENGVSIIRNVTDRTIEIIDNVTLSPANAYRIEGLHFKKELSVAAGGSLELYRVEAMAVQVDTFSTKEPVLIARNCLFDRLSVGSGLAKLDSCTVLGTAHLKNVDIINSIVMEVSDPQLSGILEYSRIPLNIKDDLENLIVEDCTSDVPVFFQNQTALAAKAVLTPNTPKTIYTGANDRGEVGYFHGGRKGMPVRIGADFIDDNALTFPVSTDYLLEDVVFEGRVEVDSGSLKLVRSAIKSLSVKTAVLKDGVPALDAKDCLFDFLSVANGLVRLEYCTIMREADLKQVHASDCIFNAIPIRLSDEVGFESLSGCIRYSRIPENIDRHGLNASSGHAGTNTHDGPILMKFSYCDDVSHNHSVADEFGEPGYGVLNPVTSGAIRFGAEDGGEMGAYHHKYYSLKVEAMLEKMREFLPVGIEPVIIYDAGLLRVPPAPINQLTDNGEAL